MRQILNLLVDLQGIDDALRDLRETQAKLVALEADNTKSLTAFDKLLGLVGARITETRAFCSEKEDEIRETETNISRSRVRLNAIQSQKELTALNKELDIARKTNQSRTEELGKLSDQLTTAEKDHAQKTTERHRLATEMASLEDDLRVAISDKQAGLGELNTRRKAIQSKLARDLFAKYERIARARNGMGVSRVQGETCSQCNMAVPPQVFIRLQRVETMEQCAHCQRILVLASALGETTAAHAP